MTRDRLIEISTLTDTIASIAGQIGGTLTGLASLPKTMVERLPKADEIITIAEAFSTTVLQ
jgi:ADP-ribosylglycohydrolase